MSSLSLTSEKVNILQPIGPEKDAIPLNGKREYVTSSNTGKADNNPLVFEFMSDIMNVVANDEHEDGFVSNSEKYISDNFNENTGELIKSAIMKLYINNYSNPRILYGLIDMMGSMSFDEANPQGQVMALGLLQHREVSLRDRAVQLFERWNSKQGIPILKELQCDQSWLQRYVDKVITYLERDGV